MTLHTTLFICTAAELAAGFPTWKPPLPEPVDRKIKNPVTGGYFTIPSLVPEWPDQPEISLQPIPQSSHAAPTSAGQAAPPLPEVVRSHPHWTGKEIGAFNLERLSDVIGAPATLECPLYGPPTCTQMLVAIPTTFFAKLRSLDLASLTAVAEEWADALKMPEDIEPLEGEPDEEPWSPADALSILEAMVNLARQAEGQEQMYLLMVP
jgi:hypothetical protein